MIIGIILSKDSLALICGAVFSFARKKYSLFYGKLDEASIKTQLPDNPDMDKVEKFVERIYRFAITKQFVRVGKAHGFSRGRMSKGELR